MSVLAESSSAPRLGAVIDGRYRLDAVIAQGGTSTVYRATHVGTERVVAVKVLDEALLGDRVAVERFLAEGRVATRVQHPNVIDVLDVGRDARDRPFLVTELLEGETLAEYLKHAPDALPVDEVAALMLPLLDALAMAHRHGIVHRDVKPENVFLRANDDGTFSPKLLDFGISKVLTRDGEANRAITLPGEAVGTPHYISPEQALGRRDIDARADVWSTGVVLYRLLAGRVPFDGADLQEVLGRVFDSIPPSPAGFGVAPTLSTVVMKCLSKDASGRYADAQALKVALCMALGLPANAYAPARVSLPSLHPPAPPEPKVTVRIQTGPRAAVATATRPAMPPAAESIPPDEFVIPAMPAPPADLHRQIARLASQPPTFTPEGEAPRDGATRPRANLATIARVGAIFAAGGLAGFLLARLVS